MKILVTIKRVIDYTVRVQLKRDLSGVVTDGVKMGINPFDEIALEEALRIRERGDASEVVAVSLGGTEVQQQLRTALAMGADRAILVEAGELQPLEVAHALKALVAREEPGLVLMGKQAIDDDMAQTGPMLAALLDWPQATFASKFEFAGGKATAVREVDGGLETLGVDLPAIVTTDLRLNQPRFVKMPDIMKARNKPLETVPLASLKPPELPRLEVKGYEAPPQRAGGGKRVADAAELVRELRARGAL
ncbi:MAG: electron transfer flavoprotein subunit beta/FixA family protein [Xanthomonadaceae bacterium]|nr:electron transfer flavoprotein subunit beta/FixA family protein [Xanthomonadaceae bacterium]